MTKDQKSLESPEPPTFKLLELPAELRLMIYELVFDTDFDERDYLSRKASLHPLYLVSHRVRHDSRRIYLKALKRHTSRIIRAQNCAAAEYRVALHQDRDHLNWMAQLPQPLTPEEALFEAEVTEELDILRFKAEIYWEKACKVFDSFEAQILLELDKMHSIKRKSAGGVGPSSG